jgi:tetratricopeptide (TPR) repeat protein
MKLLFRALLTIAIVTAAGAAAYCFCIERWRCNNLEKVIEGESLLAADRARQPRFAWRAAGQARQSLARAERCLSWCTRNPNLLMMAGLNHRTLQRYDAAAAAYKEALRLDRRPEIYFSLGATELEAGRREEAIEYFVIAGRSGYLINEIAYAEIRADVERRLREPYSRAALVAKSP